VILIGGPVPMQLATGTGLALAPGRRGPAAAAGDGPRRRRGGPGFVRGPQGLFASRKQSSGTSVQDELIHVVIPLRASCCAMLGISFTKTVPAYPPRVGPCGAPRSPPRRGALPLSAQRSSIVFAPCVSSGGRPPDPRCGLAPATGSWVLLGVYVFWRAALAALPGSLNDHAL